MQPATAMVSRSFFWSSPVMMSTDISHPRNAMSMHIWLHVILSSWRRRLNMGDSFLTMKTTSKNMRVGMESFHIISRTLVSVEIS